MHDSFALWIRSFIPAPLNASPKEWLRAALGVAAQLTNPFLRPAG